MSSRQRSNHTGAKLAVAGAAALALASGAHGHHHHHGGVLASLAAVPAGTGSGSQASWARAELRALGDPRTPADVTSLVAWQNREGGGGANNPLNTTEPAPGSTVFNSVGVQNYPAPGEGVAATAVTLRNGNYGDILSALASGGGLCGQSLAGLSTWSGGGYSQVC
jgi:hypothetical protein